MRQTLRKTHTKTHYPITHDDWIVRPPLYPIPIRTPSSTSVTRALNGHHFVLGQTIWATHIYVKQAPNRSINVNIECPSFLSMCVGVCQPNPIWQLLANTSIHILLLSISIHTIAFPRKKGKQQLLQLSTPYSSVVFLTWSSEFVDRENQSGNYV